MKVFEFHHRSRQSFDASVVLFDDVVQIFAMADLHTLVMVWIKLVQTRLVSTALVNVDKARVTVFIDGFLQKA